MKYLLVLLSVTTLFQYSSAQDTLAAKKYEERTIQPRGGYFMINEKRYESFELKPLFNQYPVPAVELKLYQKNKRVAGIFMLSALASFVVAFTQYDKNPPDYNKNLPLTYTMLGVALSTDIVAGIFGGKARRHFQKALWVYNKEVMAN